MMHNVKLVQLDVQELYMAEGQVEIVQIYVQLELHYKPIKIAWMYVQQDLYEGHANILLEYFKYVAVEQIAL